MEKMERIEKIEAQLRLWGLDGLTPEGIKMWTDDIYWLLEQAIMYKKVEMIIAYEGWDEKEKLEKINNLYSDN